MNNSLGISDSDLSAIVKALEQALAEEFGAWYAYTIAAPYLKGTNHLEVGEEFEEHAKDEFEDHAVWIMERINQLGAAPVNLLSPAMLANVAPHRYIIPDRSFNVIKLLDQNIQAEKDAIETYNKLERLTRDKDVVTNQKVKSILADELEHLQDLMEWKDACKEGKPIQSDKNGGKLTINYCNFF